MPSWLKWLVRLFVYVVCPQCGSRCTEELPGVYLCPKCQKVIRR